jgi:hypothetical protein
VLLFYILDFLVDVLVEKKSLVEWVTSYSWLKFLYSWAAWIVIQYFFVIKENRSQLKYKKRELEQLRKKYGLVENAV